MLKMGRWRIGKDDTSKHFIFNILQYVLPFTIVKLGCYVFSPLLLCSCEDSLMYELMNVKTA